MVQQLTRGSKRMSKIPTAFTVIEHYGQRKFFGAARQYSPQDYSRSAGGLGEDTEGQHCAIVETVLFKFSGSAESAIKAHVRNVLDLRVEGFDDLRRWSDTQPRAVWDQFVELVEAAIGRQYAAFGTVE